MTEQNFIPRLESLRGVAAVLVGFYHCGGMFLPFPPSGTSRVFFGLGNGMGCVVVFFVISGFVLAKSLDRSAGPSILAFCQSRAFRLLPASIVVVGLLAALHYQYGFYVGFEGNFDPINVLLNMLLLRSDINGVMWSLTVELVATPLIFWATFLYRRLGAWPLVGIVTVLFALSFIGQYVHLIGANLAPLYAFVVGVLVYFEGARLASLVSGRFAPLVAVIGALAFFLSGLMKPTAPMILVDCLAGALLVLSIAQWPKLGALKLLDWPVARFFGRVSYSFYLLNPLTFAPAICFFEPAMRQFPPMVHALALGMVATLLTAAPAYFCYRFVELPGINLGRAIGHRRMARAALSET